LRNKILSQPSETKTIQFNQTKQTPPFA
jgi:siroheme synthase